MRYLPLIISLTKGSMSMCADWSQCICLITAQNEAPNFVPIALLFVYIERCIANAKIAVCYPNVFAYKGVSYVSAAL